MNNKAKPMRIKTKRHKHSTAYYSNSTFKFTFNIIFHVNPQPVSNATKCSACEKTVKCNQKRVICDKNLSMLHMENARIHRHLF